MKYTLIELLACPACQSTLALKDETWEGSEVRGGKLTCREGNHEYPITGGVPQMMPLPEAMAGRLWREWVEKQDGLSQECNLPDPKTKAYFGEVAAEFADFCHAGGLIVDVGCGMDPHPAYAIFLAGSTYIGIDPAMGGEGREFDFVRGIGEALPMRPGLFDWALSATSLDHFPEPRRVLAEVKRVLRPTGRLGLWVGATDPDYFRRMYPSPSLRSQKDRELLWDVVRQGKFRRLARSAWHHSVVNRVRILILRWRHWTDESRLMESIFPKRSAEHFRFYTEGEVLGLLLQPGYRVIKQVLITNLEHGNSLFLIAAPL